MLRLQVSTASTHVRTRTDTQKTHMTHAHTFTLMHSNVFLIASIIYSLYAHTVYPSIVACTQAAINASKDATAQDICVEAGEPGHGVHEDASTSEYVPAGQALHSVAPVDVDTIPG